MAAKAGEAKPGGEKAGRPEKPEAPDKQEKPEKVERKKLTKAEKQGLHMERLKKTAVACIAGLIAGLLSFFVDNRGTPAGTALGILFLLAAIVFQKYVFLALRMDYLRLTAKDWVFQGFMTLAFWFITWTILLSSR
jgi:EMC6-arch